MSNTSDAADNPTIHDETDPAKEKLRAEFDALHAELEVANYGVGKNGRARRKISRLESKNRTIKRKSLEVEDAKVAAVRSSQTKRVRGSKAALEDEVIHGSLIFETTLTKKNRRNEEDDESDYIPSESDDDDKDSEDGEENGRYNLYAEELNIDIDDDDDDEENDDGDDEDNADESVGDQKQDSLTTDSSQPPKSTRQKSIADKFSGNKIAKTMYKLKNFKSYKLAQRHGEALGAHARGLNVAAVDKLKEVATAAPVAPQIYSSLGLVYESMLREEMQKAKGKENLVKGIDHSERQSNECNVDTLESVCERIKLAKKTFGSYHVAALLCKMDFSLWVRAGDAALAIANLHSYCLSLSLTLSDVETAATDTQSHGNSAAEEFVRFHKVQRTKWLEEAKEDYQAADNLCPPGISVPSKLAYTHMELGNLSEALTILTDVKNKHQKEIEECYESGGKRSRTELEKSFSTWMLYADLMLTIGHECEQWNRGIFTNENYMFKRWLRKYSKTFNWQERRFQALCMAFEAAAGSKACHELMIWLNDRVHMMKSAKKVLSGDEAKWQLCDNYEAEQNVGHQQTMSDSIEDGRKEESDMNKIEQNDSNGSISLSHDMIQSLSELRKKFHEDRCSLLSSNDSELLNFDTMTKSMALPPGSQVANEREAERTSLIAKHKQGLIDLAATYQLNKSSLIEQMNKDCDKAPQVKKDLALSATCAVVCDIAFQLVKQCLAMDLYRGGILACEAVLLYLKERALRYQDQENRWKRFDERQGFDGKPVLQLENEAYDTMLQDNDDEEESVVLSDDEDFDSPDGKKIIQSMMNGVLPPDLKVLYGISLIAEGTSPFLAIKMLKAIEFLNESDAVDVELIARCDQSDSFSIRVFRKSMVEPMNKLEAFAFISDVLRKAKKEDEWSERLLPIHEKYIEELNQSNAFSLLLDAVTPQTIMASLKVRSLTKLLFSTYRMRISVAKSLATSSNSLQLEKAYDLAMLVIHDFHRYLNAFWRTKSDGNPVSESVEMLKILSTAFSIIIAIFDTSDSIKIKSLHTVVNKLKVFVAIICRIEFNDLFLSKTTLKLDSLRYFPIPSNWQSDEHCAMSRCAYNLCVAGAVSSFSGWENDEFTLNLLKKHWKETFFGVSLKGKYVAGYLSGNNEERLSSLWQLIELVIPTLTPLDFENALSYTKHDDWYKKVISNLKSFEDEPVSSFGEDYALSILLMFAQATLMFAKEQDDKRKQESLVKHSLSIILPTSQFCLEQSLWDSETGTKAAGENSDWQIFSTANSELVQTAKTRKPSKKNQPTKIQQKNKQQTVKVSKTNQRSTSPFSKLIKISADMMLKEWTGKRTFEGSDEEDKDTDDDTTIRLNKWSNSASGKSMLAMKKLDYSIKKLRQCVTIIALQKASLQVALVLLEVAGTKECQNPFICLSQAAIFAAQGPKGGNNDEDFKKPLPRETECTAEEALQVLGRADCLRALHFTNEAVFLCSYVARVCCLHRDRQEPDHPWTPRWRIIGIMTYTVSVSIDSSICSIMQGEEMQLTLDSWDKSVRAEIGRGRSDAIALQKFFGRQNSFFESKFSSLKVSTVPKQNNQEDNDDSWNECSDEDYDDFDDDQSCEEDRDDICHDEQSADEEHVYDLDEYADELLNTNGIQPFDHKLTGSQLMSSVPPLPPILEVAPQSTCDFANIPSVEI